MPFPMYQVGLEPCGINFVHFLAQCFLYFPLAAVPSTRFQFFFRDKNRTAAVSLSIKKKFEASFLFFFFFSWKVLSSEFQLYLVLKYGPFLPAHKYVLPVRIDLMLIPSFLVVVTIVSRSELNLEWHTAPNL